MMKTTEYPIVYGSSVKLISSEKCKGHVIETFSYTMYVRGTDIEKYLSKVTFDMDTKFICSYVHEVIKAPFDHTGFAWNEDKENEFTLYFKNSSHETVKRSHCIRLSDARKFPFKTVVSETTENL